MFPCLLLLPTLCLCGFCASGSFPLPLSAEEERRCLALLENGTEAEKEAAKQELILHNLRLVAHIAKKYHSDRTEQEELISIGTVGLIKAILSYNSGKSTRLVTYASKCIDKAILSQRLISEHMTKIMLYPMENGAYFVTSAAILI